MSKFSYKDVADSLETENTELKKCVADLEQQVADLEAQLEVEE
jgi:cell division protein FtsB